MAERKRTAARWLGAVFAYVRRCNCSGPKVCSHPRCRGVGRAALTPAEHARQETERIGVAPRVRQRGTAVPPGSSASAGVSAAREQCQHDWVTEHGSSAEFCCLCGIGPFEQAERPVVRQPASEPASEPDIEAIRRRWHTYHDRGAHDYTDEGCRILAEHAFRDVNALLAALAAARGDTP